MLILPVLPPALIGQYPFIHLGGERHYALLLYQFGPASQRKNDATTILRFFVVFCTGLVMLFQHCLERDYTLDRFSN